MNHLDEIAEYVRQRELMVKDLGDTIHNCWTDPAAEMAPLTLTALTELLALARKQSAQLEAIRVALEES